MWVAVFFVCALLASGVTGSNSTKPAVFVFTDANTDDVQAIKLLLKYADELDVVGLTASCAGFCNMGPAIQNLFGLLAFMGRDDVPVWAGSAYAMAEIDSGNYSCTYQKTVPLFPKGKIWADTILGLNQRYPRLPDSRNYRPGFPVVYDYLPPALAQLDPSRPVYFLSLGPMTEIAILFREFPGTVMTRVSRIYAMGGAVNVSGNLFFPRPHVPNTVAECNMYTDPQAAHAVFSSGVPITLVPLDATNAFQLSWSFLSNFTATAITPEAHFCHDLLVLIKNNSAPTSTYSLWDPLTATILANPALITRQETLNMTVIIDDTTGQVGRTIVDNFEGKPVDVVFAADPDFFNSFASKLNEQRAQVYSGAAQIKPFFF
jgi:inosine-uridine nucleoside N-ribohydrolase